MQERKGKAVLAPLGVTATDGPSVCQLIMVNARRAEMGGKGAATPRYRAGGGPMLRMRLRRLLLRKAFWTA